MKKQHDNPPSEKTDHAANSVTSGEQLWVGAIVVEGTHVFARTHASRQKAEEGIVSYLRENEGYDGDSFADACDWLSENAERMEVQIFEAEGSQADLSAGRVSEKVITLGLSIQDPPKEHGDEPLYRVIYVIDVNAGDADDAADFAHRIMSDPSSLPPVLHVFDHNGNCKTIDLAGVAMFSKITVGFVS